MIDRNVLQAEEPLRIVHAILRDDEFAGAFVSREREINLAISFALSPAQLTGRRGVQKLRQLHRGGGCGRKFDLFLLAGLRVSVVVPASTRGGLHLAQRLVRDFDREKDEKRKARDERENVQNRCAFVVFRAAHVADLSGFSP